LRYPEAIRPWQHVLDCLNGYLKLIDHMLATGKGGEWNFGPALAENFTVGKLADGIAKHFGATGLSWKLEATQQPHEASLLLLDSNKARNNLGWGDQLNFEQTVDWTASWYKDSRSGNQVATTRNQIKAFLELIS